MTDESSTPVAGSEPDAYRGVLRVVLAAAVLGMLLAVAAALWLGNPLFLDAYVSLLLASGVLAAVMRARTPSQPPAAALSPAEAALLPPGREVRLMDWAAIEPKGLVLAIGVAGAVSNVIALALSWRASPPLQAVVTAVLGALAAAGLAATAARYFARADADRFREAAGLARGGRVLAWVLIAAAAGALLSGTGMLRAAVALHAPVLLVNSAVCIELLVVALSSDATRFHGDLRVLALLGDRANPLASLLDTAERQLGIDVRSTWALDVVRRSAEPLLASCLLIGWLTTALTVIPVEEVGIVERLGVPLASPPLEPGLHAHWPWPIDRVLRFPVRRVQTLMVGHEGDEEESGPEDVLWAQQHGTTPEYTLLLGDGRDLIAVDAALKFRISDPRAWYFNAQNPEDALRAIAYRAVMKATVGHTLAQTLSENVAVLTAQMRDRVQADADALALGVEVVGFTVGGMHPPVAVAADYQAVVSAELARTTAAIGASAYRNEIVPAAEAEAVAKENAARARDAEDRARAAGEAWSFRTLESEYRPAPDEFRFRRRLEALEKNLAGRRFTLLDTRIQRDGGELWLVR